MTDDIVTRLREDCDGDCKYATSNEFVPCDKCEAADEIERLRAERFEWFLVARQLRDALIGGQDKDAALDEYLRTRGRLEDPRE